jgi:hypothetical protein
VATNPAVAKKTKIPQSVGKEFMEADKGKKFKGGGEMKESKEMVKKEIGFMKKKGAPKSMIKHEMKEAGMKKMASGGLAAGHKSADGIAMKGKTKGKEVKMALGGFAMGAVRKAAAAKAAPMLQKAAAAGAKKMGPINPNAVRPGSTPKPMPGSTPRPAPPPPGLSRPQNPSAPGVNPRGAMTGGGRPASQQLQFLSDKLRGLPMKPSGVTKMPMVPGTQRGIGSQMASKPTGVGMGMGAKKLAGAGASMAKALMGKKAGGLAAGHKEADGIAKKGKTRAMQVKMAGGGKTKKYC